MPEFRSLSELITPEGLALLRSSGKDMIRRVGFDVVRNVIFDVMIGRNLRDATEILTRRRLVGVNLATVSLFLKGAALYDHFIEQLPNIASNILSQGRLSKQERWLALWALGLNDKAYANVLRDDSTAIEKYRDSYLQICRDAVTDQISQVGELSGQVRLSAGADIELNWASITYLLTTVGAQTLAIRGSEKSAYGKLFEKLILGSLLSILGFKLVPTRLPGTEHNVFWLSSRNEKRESDATLLYQRGNAVRFDIGFIGRGNPEISLDNVTRFEHELVLGNSRYTSEVIIIVDRIGQGSRIGALAKQAGGHLVQMSAAYWPQHVARILSQTIGFTHEMVTMPESAIEGFLHERLKQAPLEDFIQFADDDAPEMF